MPKSIFENHFEPGLKILRYPRRKNELLEAWDSADELMVQHLASLDPEELIGKRLLILNDLFGVLGGALQKFHPTSFTDSFVSSQGVYFNSSRKLQPLNSLDDLQGIYDWILIKIPVNTSYFEDLLCRLTHHLNLSSKLICGAMLKHLPKASFELLHRYIGSTQTSLAKKKARLIFSQFEKVPVDSPYPLSVSLDLNGALPKTLENDPWTHHSNLFSREKLDIGTRFFLEHLPQGEFKTILDLGCANGILGILAKILNPAAQILFSDDSKMALESARTNYARFSPNSDAPATFIWTNCFENQPPEQLDLVLCNPPFHQNGIVGGQIAWQMFTDAHRALKKGGLLRIIGNAHLNYPATLKRIFGNFEIVASNKKFTIAESTKQ